ncbi:dihydroorotase [Spiroplasma eriocheiris]|uniref:Dihydroorotase n=2 Tax=Spiroplasma eriocheiris TaxID=315358 RepID=A0A0H3XMF6_9MOLU|nr:dihydroorotase [Spiroplasma eriocheiris]
MTSFDIKQYANFEQYNFFNKAYVSPGWIDIHTHCYEKQSLYTDDPDEIGVRQGVTTVIDAGSVGANDVDEFYHCKDKYQTKVYCWLNVAKIGIPFQGELLDLNNIDEKLISQKLQQYPDFIVGLKVRMSKSVVGTNKLLPLVKTINIQNNNNLVPVMIHIGNGPPNINDILALTGKNVIITHAYNGKSNRIFQKDTLTIEFLNAALQRGLKLDIGHGSESFSFASFKWALAHNYGPDFISSDIYQKNRCYGPVYSLANVLSKMLYFGLSLKEIIAKVTIEPAIFLGFSHCGKLAVNYQADLTFFEIKEVEILAAEGMQQEQTIKLTKEIKPVMCVVKNSIIELGERKYGKNK